MFRKWFYWGVKLCLECKGMWYALANSLYEGNINYS